MKKNFSYIFKFLILISFSLSETFSLKISTFKIPNDKIKNLKNFIINNKLSSILASALILETFYIGYKEIKNKSKIKKLELKNTDQEKLIKGELLNKSRKLLKICKENYTTQIDDLNRKLKENLEITKYLNTKVEELEALNSCFSNLKQHRSINSLEKELENLKKKFELFEVEKELMESEINDLKKIQKFNQDYKKRIRKLEEKLSVLKTQFDEIIFEKILETSKINNKIKKLFNYINSLQKNAEKTISLNSIEDFIKNLFEIKSQK